MTVRPDGRGAVWCSLDGGTLVGFDPDTLALDRVASPPDGFIGGGHAFYLPDGGPPVSLLRGPCSSYIDDARGVRLVLRLGDRALEVDVLVQPDRDDDRPHDEDVEQVIGGVGVLSQPEAPRPQALISGPRRIMGAGVVLYVELLALSRSSLASLSNLTVASS